MERNRLHNNRRCAASIVNNRQPLTAELRGRLGFLTIGHFAAVTPYRRRTRPILPRLTGSISR